MNTYIWGPPLWRILHTVSFTPINIPTDTVKTYNSCLLLLLTSLQHILPCSFCRASYQQYYWELPNVPHKITSGLELEQNEMVNWVYELHTLVNQKLNSQCNNLPLHCLKKRQQLHTVFCSEEDVWDVLAILALNYTQQPNQSVDQKINQYATATFIWCLCILLTNYNMDLCEQIKKHCKLQPPLFTSRSEYVSWLQKLSHNSFDIFRYEIARAKQCQDKSCV